MSCICGWAPGVAVHLCHRLGCGEAGVERVICYDHPELKPATTWVCDTCWAMYLGLIWRQAQLSLVLRSLMLPPDRDLEETLKYDSEQGAWVLVVDDVTHLSVYDLPELKEVGPTELERALDILYQHIVGAENPLMAVGISPITVEESNN